MWLIWSTLLPEASTCSGLTESLLLGADWVMILMTFMVQHFKNEFTVEMVLSAVNTSSQ